MLTTPVVNSQQMFPHVAPQGTAATQLLRFEVYEGRRRHGLRLDEVRTLKPDTIDIIDVYDAKVPAQEGVDSALKINASVSFVMRSTKKER